MLIPIIHFVLFNYDPNNYHLQSFFDSSLSYRLDNEKKYNNYYHWNYTLIEEILKREKSSILSSQDLTQIPSTKYLDKIYLSDKSGNKIDATRKSSMGGGGIKMPEQFLVMIKNDNKIKIPYRFSATLDEHLNNYLIDYENFKERELNTYKEIGFFDFWFSSVSLFKFNEIIPNSIFSRLLWLFQAATTFIYLFVLSRFLTKKKNTSFKGSTTE